MNDKQKNKYVQILKNKLKNMKKNSSNVNYFVKCREISNIVFPDFINTGNIDNNAVQTENQQRRK